jgi:hypothetical protein
VIVVAGRRRGGLLGAEDGRRRGGRLVIVAAGLRRGGRRTEVDDCHRHGRHRFGRQNEVDGYSNDDHPQLAH